MATKKALATKKPKETLSVITQRGLKAQSLAMANQATLGKRITSTFLTTLGSDLTSLGAVGASVITAHDGSVQFTAAQNSALVSGHALVTAARTAVKGQQPAKDVLLAYGVGTKTSKLLVKDVSAALGKIITRATAEPTEAAAFGIIADDVASMTAAVAAIKTADSAQEAARAAAPLTTQQRNLTLRRVLASVHLIAGAGMLAFANDATNRALFAALIRKAA